MADNDEKIVKILESLQADVKELKQGQQQQGKAIEGITTRLDQQDKILMALAENGATVLEEQQQQRTDIRSLHTEVHGSDERQAKRIEEAKEELRAEILTSRAEAKADNLRILGKLDKTERRVSNLEEKTETPNPHKN